MAKMKCLITFVMVTGRLKQSTERERIFGLAARADLQSVKGRSLSSERLLIEQREILRTVSKDANHLFPFQIVQACFLEDIFDPA
jgi:hypothetical protein